jgi:ribonuclease R
MALEDKRAPCVYRIHDQPKADRLQNAGEFIEGFGLSLPKGQNVQPKQLNQLLNKASELPYVHLIHEVILRTQAQARYSPENIGHYGLALAKYAHFTSPIRRYADLLVHRSLVSAYGLGPGGLSKEEEVRLEEMSDAISNAERKSIEAERNATDRFTSAYLAGHVGADFTGRISGVTSFGMFVTLDESGGDGIIPVRTLNDDYYVHDEERHALIGRRKGKLFRLGADVTVRLKEADGLTGSLVLELVGDSKNGADVPGFQEPKKFKRRGPGKKDKPQKPVHKKNSSGKNSLKTSAKSHKGKK